MVNTYNFLKNVWQRAKENLHDNPISILFTASLLTITLPYKYNSMAVIAFVLVALFLSFRRRFLVKKEHLPLVGMYVLMVLSLFWTLDSKESIKALGKEIPLLILPVVFGFTHGFSTAEKQKILLWYARGFTLLTLFYLIRALIRYHFTGTTDVFFYHELVTFDVNAIHVSVYTALAFFILVQQKEKTALNLVSTLVLVTFIFLLSSKNIIVVFSFLSLVHLVKQQQKITVTKLGLALLVVALIGMAFLGKISSRFEEEIISNGNSITINDNIGGQQGLVYNVPVRDAWSKEVFQHNDYFPGTSLRVYQIRIFIEMVQEDFTFFTGYGVNATDKKIAQKREQHNLYPGYDKFNFHNQYIQNFAETGIVSLFFLLAALYFNLKNAIKNKDFIHFSFAILMISLFLTESFLSRQRGVVFFTLMYCFFNTFQLENSAKKTI